MGENLSFREQDFNNLLLAKLVELKTEVVLNSAAISALTVYMDTDGKNLLEKTRAVLEEQRAKTQLMIAEELIAELKGISVDAEDFLRGLLS